MAKWKKWEIALLLGLTVTLLWGAWNAGQQEQLARKMIRLHVIANSDTEEDQALKLQVRDAVLDYTTRILTQANDQEAAEIQLQFALPAIQRLAMEKVGEEGYDYEVAAYLEPAEFPHKDYEGFSLPAGEYTALRLVIGEGQGHNWWCVVYPPLCTAAATELRDTAVAAGMNDEDVALMTAENGRYVLKFRSIELWQQFRQWIKK